MLCGCDSGEKKLQKYILRVHSQTCFGFGEPNGIKCKKNNTVLALNLMLTLIITLTLILS